MMKNAGTKQMFVPKLRFPEFRKSPAWKSGRTSEIAAVLQGYGFPERHQGKRSGEFPFYKVSDISRTVDAGGYCIDGSTNYIDTPELEELKAKALPTGTTIFAKIGEALRLNKRVITTRPCVIDNNTAGVKAVAGRATELFLYYLWSTVSLDKYAGGVVPAVSKSAIENILVSFPPIPEQRRIADCLRSVDELIGAEGLKLDALKAYKKGLMQHLFPCEGETVPNLRFPEFQDGRDWEMRRLSDLLFETKLRNRELKYGADDVLSVSGEYGCVNQIAHLGRSYAGASVKDYHIVETGDIVYTKSPLRRNPYGIIKQNKGKAGVVSTLYAVYQPRDICFSGFLDHYFSRDFNLNSYLQPIVNKGAKNDMKVNNSDVLRGEIWVPQLAEQKSVADCLSSLDYLIAAQSGKLAALKTHKQGLMQQLFASPVEAEV
jgi:type I restriction enzyme, S subunit